MADCYNCRRSARRESGGYDGWKRPGTRSQNPVGNVAAWEKKFCWEVGSVPWKKIVDSQKCMHIFDRVVIQWNDSAGEEAFREAKLRYWLKINAKRCGIGLPSPDLFIDKIVWSRPEALDHVVALQELDDEASGDEDEDEDQKEKVNMVNSFNIRIDEIKPTGWDEDFSELFHSKFRLLTGMVVGDD